MIKLLFGWNVLLTLVIVFLLTMKKDDTIILPANTATVGVVNIANLPTGSIVYVNTDSLMNNYKLVKDFKQEMERERSVKENAFQNKMAALEKQVTDFKEIAQRLSPEEGQRQQQELMLKEQKLGEYRENLMAELSKKEIDKNTEMTKRISDYLNKLNASGKYTYVMGYAQGGGILHANKTLDITTQVVAGLNAEYKK
ncbi:MAG: OmpH family outer membrane protein [Bacteroidia bacterium]|nr:OmpH family outer membrane protein [Bacteroidia bacterium]